MNPSREFGSRLGGGVWNALNRLMIGAVILALCAFLILAFIPISKERREQIARVDQLNAHIAKEKALLSRGTREEELLKNDPAYVETIARDRLDVMKSGETIIRLEPSRSPTPAKN